MKTSKGPHPPPLTSTASALIAALLAVAFTLQPQTARAGSYTWDAGGGSTKSWHTVANWVGDPASLTFDANSVITFYTAINSGASTLGSADRTIGSLVFNSTATTAMTLYLADGTAENTDRTLTLGSASVAPTITVDAASANHTIGVTKGGVTLASNLTATVNGSATLTIARPINGAFGITKSGSGTVTLSGANTYTGRTTVNAGTLNIENDQSSANGGWLIGSSSSEPATVNFNSGSTIEVASGNPITLGPGGVAAKPTLNVAGTVTNNGSLNVNRRTSTLNLNSGANWTQDGTMAIQPFASTAYTPSLTVNGGATFTYTGSDAITLAPSGNNSGGARLNLSGGTFTTGKKFANTSGATTGTGTADINFSNGGTLKLSASIPDLFTTTGSANNVSLGTGGGVVDTAGFSTTLGTIIDGSGSLTISSSSGSGALTLSGANTYTGNTTISGGTLTLASTGQLKFGIGADGVNNQVNGSGTVNFDGAVNLDVSSADTTAGNSWTLVDVANLTETFGATFTVTSTAGAFTETAPGVWKKQIDGTKRYVFAEATGVLSVQANNAPMAQAIAMGARAGVLTSLQIIGGKFAPTDIDGDSVMLQSVSNPSANGGAVVISGGSINYTAASSFSGTDTFDYTVSDGFGGTDTKTITVTVTSANVVSPNVVFGPTVVGSDFVVRFAGVPGTAYTVETNAAFSGPGWAKFNNYTAPTEVDSHPYGVGIFQVTKPNEGEPSLYFRTIHPSY